MPPAHWKRLLLGRRLTFCYFSSFTGGPNPRRHPTPEGFNDRNEPPPRRGSDELDQEGSYFSGFGPVVDGRPTAARPRRRTTFRADDVVEKPKNVGTIDIKTDEDDPDDPESLADLLLPQDRKISADHAGPIGDSLLKKLNLDDSPKEEAAAAAASAPLEPSESISPIPEEADEIFRKMKETGLIPNAVTMLDGLCKDGLIHEAMKLFGLMREKGSIPEVVVYTAVVEGFCKAAKYDDAIRIFRKMQSSGVVPNAFSYGVVIQGLCRGMRLDDAVGFVFEMFEAGHAPNAATFVGLVNLACQMKGVEEGERLVKGFQDRNFAIDEKSIREHLDRKGPFSPVTWEVIFGKKVAKRIF